MAKQAYRAVEAFVCVDGDGVKRRFDPTTLVSEGHWALKSHRGMFEPIEDADTRATHTQSIGPRHPVEQGTAAPGEKRSTRRSRTADPAPAEPAGTDTEPADAPDTDSEV